MAAFHLGTRRQRLRIPSLAATALVSLVLAACGGGGNDAPTPTPSPRPLPTQQPLLNATPVATATEEVQATQEYVVQPGDSLGAIATQFGVTVEAIVAANDITNPDLIQPGDTLTIPAP